MTLQIDSLAISADEANTQDVQIDQLDEQVAALDADILTAIELRSQLAHKLAAASAEAVTEDEGPSTFDALGADGTSFARMLARLASVIR